MPFIADWYNVDVEDIKHYIRIAQSNGQKEDFLSKLYVASFSIEQKHYHVESVSNMLEVGRRCLLFPKKYQNSYIPFYIGSQEDCSKACIMIEQHLINSGLYDSPKYTEFWEDGEFKQYLVDKLYGEK